MTVALSGYIQIKSFIISCSELVTIVINMFGNVFDVYHVGRIDVTLVKCFPVVLSKLSMLLHTNMYVYFIKNTHLSHYIDVVYA